MSWIRTLSLALVLLVALSSVQGGKLTLKWISGAFDSQKYGLIWYDPDPYIVTVVGSDTWTTSTKSGSPNQAVTWNEARTYSAELSASTSIRFDIYDDVAFYSDHNMLNGNFLVGSNRTSTITSGSQWVSYSIVFIPTNKCLVTPSVCAAAHNCVYLGDNAYRCDPINNCDTNNGGCGTNSLCTYTGPGTNICTCNTGYASTTNNGKNCEPINNCLTNNGGCGTNSLCTYTGPGINTCACLTGYASSTNNGINCQAINNCLTNNGGCGTNSACTYTGPGLNSCACNSGYSSSSSDGRNCQPINNCLTNNGGCGTNSACTYTGPGANSCACNSGYQSTSNDGKNCQPINNCLTNNGGCGSYSTCACTGPALSSCSCHTGYNSSSSDGKNCQPINACLTNNGGCGSLPLSVCSYAGPNISSCACASGSWSVDGKNCVAFTTCTAGKYEVVAPTPSTNRVCASCPAGQACSGSGSAQDCGAVNLYSAGGAASCSSVSVGYYSTPADTSPAKRTGQAPCLPGYFCAGGISTACASGTYQSIGQQTSCINCPVCATGLTETVACNPTTLTECRDLTAPAITLTDPSQVHVEAKIQTYTEPGFSAIDTYEGDISGRVSVSAQPNTQLIGTYDLTYSVSDQAGNAANQAIRKVVVQDTTPPSIVLNGASVVALDFQSTYTDDGAVATDVYDGDLTSAITVSGLGLLDLNLQVLNTDVTVTYQVSDSSGNGATATRTVQIRVLTTPVITLVGPGTVYIEASSTYAPYSDQGATARSNADGNLTPDIVTQGASAVNNTLPGQYTITYAVKSKDGQSEAPSVTRTVVVRDTTRPTITLVGNSAMTVEGKQPYVEPGVTLTDNLDSAATLQSRLQISGSVNSSAPAGTKFVLTYSVSDTQGNSAVSMSRVVTIVDTQPPVISITGPSSMTVEAATSYTDAGATAIDVLDGSVAVSVNNTVNLYPSLTPYTFSVIYEAQDKAGNMAVTMTREVTVVDSTPPVITVLGTEVTVEAGTFYSDAGATASDTLDGAVSITVTNPVNLNPASTPAVFYVKYDAVDKAGNAAVTKQRKVTVVDTTPPVLTLAGPTTMTLESGDYFQDPVVTILDSLGGDISNKVELTIYALPPAIINLFKTARRGAPQLPANIFSILNLTPYIVPAFNPKAPSGTVFLFVYGVADDAGNKAWGNRTLLLLDTQPPQIFLGAGLTLDLEGRTPSIPFVRPSDMSATDIHDGVMTPNVTFSVVSSLGQSGGLNIIDTSKNVPVGTTYNITFSVADAAGNQALDVTRVMTLVDTKPPVVTLNGGEVVDLEIGAAYSDLGATSVDQYDGSLTGQIQVTGANLVNSSAANVGQTFVVTYTSIDSSGNTGRATRNVTIINPPATAASSSSSSASSLPMVAGGAGAGVVILVAVIVLVRRRRAPDSSTKSRNQSFNAVGPSSLGGDEKSKAWFHGRISREIAEARLSMAGQKSGMFLVWSKGALGRNFVVSFVHHNQFFHSSLIQRDSGEFVLQGQPCPGWGNTVADVIDRLGRKKCAPINLRLATPVAPIHIEEDGPEEPMYQDLPLDGPISNPVYGMNLSGNDQYEELSADVVQRPKSLSHSVRPNSRPITNPVYQGASQEEAENGNYLQISPELLNAVASGPEDNYMDVNHLREERKNVDADENYLDPAQMTHVKKDHPDSSMYIQVQSGRKTRSPGPNKAGLTPADSNDTYIAVDASKSAAENANANDMYLAVDAGKSVPAVSHRPRRSLPKLSSFSSSSKVEPAKSPRASATISSEAGEQFGFD